MRQKEIIYDNLLRLVSNLANEASVDAFYNLLAIESDQALFLTICEDIENNIPNIVNSRTNLVIHPDFESFLHTIKRLQDNFPTYGQRINEIRLIVALIEKLNESLEGTSYNLNRHFRLTVFNLVRTSKISYSNYLYHDSADLANSVVLFDFANIESALSFIATGNLTPDLIFNLLLNIGNSTFPLADEKYVLIKTAFSNSQSLVWATICLHLVKEGEAFHQPTNYLAKPVVHNSRKVKVGLNYQQFADTLIILSEYNYQKDILDKFLRLYHLLENFMYKFPLTVLEKKYQGKVFSIRDFQIMNATLDNNEPTSLTNLIKRIFIEIYDGTDTFQKFVLDKLQSLEPGILTIPQIDSLFLKMDVRGNATFANIVMANNAPNFPKIFAAIIYKFRNSLVHNRETEFHLNHFTLNSHPTLGNSPKLFLESFLIPVLEEIVFYLITKKNDLVWYQNSTLKLWDKNLTF